MLVTGSHPFHPLLAQRLRVLLERKLARLVGTQVIGNDAVYDLCDERNQLPLGLKSQTSQEEGAARASAGTGGGGRESTGAMATPRRYRRQPGSGPFTGTFFLPPFQRNHILDTKQPAGKWSPGSPGKPSEAVEDPGGARARPQISHVEEAVALAEDVARWTWHKGRFEEIFGERSEGRFVHSWPSGKSLAILLSFDMQADVDAAAAWSSHPNAFWENGAINFCDATMRLYDAREGLARVLRILDKYHAPATFMFCGLTAEWYPELAREVVEAGHEIGVHGYRHVKLCNLDADEELEELTLATNAIREFVGDRPLGWRSPLYSVTERTLDHLRDLGYAWHSDFHDQDFPYVLTKGRKPIVEIPPGNDDWGQYNIFTGAGSPLMGGTRYGTAEGVWSSMKAEFDILYEESRSAPRVLHWAMHPKISGRPYPAAVLDRLLAYVVAHQGVWIATANEVASLA